jgi:hypothetical protein
MSTGETAQAKRGLSRIPFTVATEARIKSLSFWLTVVGWIGIAAAVVDLVSLATPGRNLGQIVNAIVHILVATWCFQAATAFKKVATTDEADQAYLVQGFFQLRKIFLFQGILILIGLAFVTAVLLFLVLHHGGA